MANDNCPTPPWLLGFFEDYFDPCPLNDNPKTNGLNIDWEDRTYVNPPYSKPEPWIDKAIDEAQKGKRIVMLLRADTSTKYFSKLHKSGARITFFYGRIKFIGDRKSVV